MEKPTFDYRGFYAAVKRRVLISGRTWASVGSDTGINTSSLSRLSNGQEMDGASCATLAFWAGIDITRFVNQESTVSATMDEAEDMAFWALKSYLVECCAPTDRKTEFLKKLIHVAGVLCAQTEGSAPAAEHMRDIADNLELLFDPQSTHKWKEGDLNGPL